MTPLLDTSPVAGRVRVMLPSRIAIPSRSPSGCDLQLAGACMGTRWQVRVLAASFADATDLRRGIAATLEEVEAQMSHFRADSLLCRYATLACDEWLQLPPQFAEVMRAALHVARESGGAFDPAAGALIDAWGFGALRPYSSSGFVPAMTVGRLRQRWQELVLDDAGHLLQPGGVALNLAAIAKGFAVDAVSRWLRAQGCVHHLVEVGGELRGEGMKPDLQPWWVVLEAPAPTCPLPATRIALHGLAVATSGNYRRRYLHAGRSLAHTVDPRSGEPVRHGLASVSVLHESCMLADAWATAIMVLGPQAGLALAEQHDLAAILQWQDPVVGWQEATSTFFDAMGRA